jgi:ketosteroid isomerase-like protein
MHVSMDTVSTAKALYAAFNAHNIPGILALLENDVEWASFGPDFALAIGYFSGRAGVQDFFAKLVGPDGQQVDSYFQPNSVTLCDDGTVHVMGNEAGTLTANVANGAYAGKPFWNDFDHTLMFGQSGLISNFRANYNLALPGSPTWKPWPPTATSSKPSPTKKPAPKKPTAKKPATKQPPSKKPVATYAYAKAPATKKSSAKASTRQSSSKTSKKTSSKKTSSKKTSSKRSR